jgi:hypothetical protein
MHKKRIRGDGAYMFAIWYVLLRGAANCCVDNKPNKKVEQCML